MMRTAGQLNVVHAPSKHAEVQGRQSAQGKVNYVDRPDGNQPLWLNVYSKEETPSNLSLRETEVTVTNVHTVKDKLSLEKNGFVLEKLVVPELDWENKEEVERVYYPLVEKLLLQATGASRVHIFDHTLRNGRLANDSKIAGANRSVKSNVTNPGQPVGMVHVDYTHESGIDRLNALLPQEAEQLRKTPFAVVQVWRPLRGPVKGSPLGMIDASTVESRDLTPYQINFPGRTGYNFAVHHNANHKWYFADQMETDEAYLFVCYESRLDRARFTPHSGFHDLSVGDDAPPRSSVELRSYVFWEHEAPRDLQRVW